MQLRQHSLREFAARQHATRAAVEEGVVPGGGGALVRAQKALDKLEGANEDQTVGIKTLSRSIEEPLSPDRRERRRRCRGCPERRQGGQGRLWLQRRAPASTATCWKKGILDPAKVTRLALQNAASVAGLLLTTEVMIAEAPKDEEHAHGGAPGGMGGMGGMDKSGAERLRKSRRSASS